MRASFGTNLQVEKANLGVFFGGGGLVSRNNEQQIYGCIYSIICHKCRMRKGTSKNHFYRVSFKVWETIMATRGGDKKEIRACRSGLGIMPRPGNPLHIGRNKHQKV